MSVKEESEGKPGGKHGSDPFGVLFKGERDRFCKHQDSRPLVEMKATISHSSCSIHILRNHCWNLINPCLIGQQWPSTQHSGQN